jgi:hypothetical protein
VRRGAATSAIRGAAHIPPPSVAGGSGDRDARAGSACCDCVALDAAHTCGAPGRRSEGRVARVARGHARLAGCGTRMWHAQRTSRCRGRRSEVRDARAARSGAQLAAVATRRMRHTQVSLLAHIPPPPWRAGRGSRRAIGTGTCSARCDRDAPGAAHTSGAPGAHFAAGRLRRSKNHDARAARGRARTAEVETRRLRHTQVQRPAHIPPQAMAGGHLSRRVIGTGTCSTRCGRDAPEAAHTSAAPGAHPAASHGRRGSVAPRDWHGDVLGSLRSRRAGSGTHKWHARRTSRRKPWQAGGGSRRASGSRTC